MSNESGNDDGEHAPGSGEASYDALGDTHLGRSLKELIKEIGKEKDAVNKGLESGAGGQDADSLDLSASRFDQDLEIAVSSQRPAGAGKQSPPPTRGNPPDTAELSASADAEISEAMSGMQAILQRFAEAERRRCEQQLAEWKEQLKKATMIVIKKQVDNARARWMQSQGVNHARVAAQYQRLKALADKVAKQKAQIQKAKQELEQKLEVADRLHSEFDEIRNVLDGQIGAIDALDKGEGPNDK